MRIILIAICHRPLFQTPFQFSILPKFAIHSFNVELQIFSGPGMSVRTITIALICTLVLAGCLSTGSEVDGNALVLEGIGTPEACLISDTVCLENKFYTECDPASTTVVDSCGVWLAELESFAEPRHAQIKLLTATTYYRMSEIRVWIETPAYQHLNDQREKLASVEQYRLKVRELAQEIYDEDRSNSGAMTYLSLTSDSDEESLQWQRRIVRTEKPGNISCRLLNGALNRVYDTSENRSRAASETAGCYMTSYRKQELHLGKWNTAGEAIHSMERAGQTIRKNRFLAEVKSDVDPEKRLRDLRNISRLDPSEVEFTLRTLCMGSVREMLGVEYCSRAIRDTLQSISGLTSEAAMPYTDAVAEGIRDRLQSSGLVVTENLSPLMAELASLIERSVISRGLVSGKVYSTYSRLVSHDANKSLDALLKAVELAPEDAEVRQHLGGVYTQLGFPELAIEQYELAIIYSPQYIHSSLRAAINRIKNCQGAASRFSCR